MEAWGRAQNVKNIILIPDGNGEFTEKLGMLVDKADLGFGRRSWRYSMLVHDGTIEKMFIEPDKPGDPFEVSDADTMLRFIDPDVELPDEVTIISKPGCPFCLKAKKLLRDHGLQYEDIELGGGVSYKSLRNLTGHSTAPQIIINGKIINGLEELEGYLGNGSKGALASNTMQSSSAAH
jgi:glutaredoxin-like protein